MTFKMIMRKIMLVLTDVLFSAPSIYKGRYSSWSEARSRSSGYEAPNILAKVLEASLAVKNGEAAFERDSVVFKEPELNSPLIAALGFVAGETGGNLNILDVGGSLGSSYWQSRPYLSPRVKLTWSVVEQPHFVEAGRKHFADTPLKFFESIEEAERSQAPDVLLFSGVIQYVEDPDWIVKQIKKSKAPFVILTRLPWHYEDKDYVTIQHVPESIYKATYPVWMFAASKLSERLDHILDVIMHATFEDSGPSNMSLCRRLSVTSDVNAPSA